MKFALRSLAIFFSNLETLEIYFFPNCVLSFFIFSNKELGLHHLHVVSFLISNKHEVKKNKKNSVALCYLNARSYHPPSCIY